MRIGIVGDVHEPFTHPMYRKFVSDVFDSWDVRHVHFVGDLVDLHALGFWDHDPNGLSAESESEAAAVGVQRWRDQFPKATVSIGNHDERQYRRARKAGIPDRYIRDYADVWQTPKWDWQMWHRFDGVLYEHGTGSSGKDAALNRAVQKRTSLVMGHVHSYAGCKYHTNEFSRIFGLNVGCGVDCEAYAMAYGRPFPIRPVLGCGVVIDGEAAYFEPMPCGVGERYHKSKGGKGGG